MPSDDDTGYPDIPSIPAIKKRQHLFTDINAQRNTQEVIHTIRSKQLDHSNLGKNIQRHHKTEVLQAWDAEDYQWRTLSALETLKELAEKQLAAPRKIGRVYGCRMLLTGGSIVTTLDLMEGKNGNVPVNATIDLPYRRAWKVTLFNEGPGRILFNFNMAESSIEANVTLSPNVPFPYDPGEPKIESINVRAVPVDATLNIIIEV